MNLPFLTEEELAEYEERCVWAMNNPESMANWTLRLLSEVRQGRVKNAKAYAEERPTEGA